MDSCFFNTLETVGYSYLEVDGTKFDASLGKGDPGTTRFPAAGERQRPQTSGAETACGQKTESYCKSR